MNQQLPTTQIRIDYYNWYSKSEIQQNEQVVKPWGFGIPKASQVYENHISKATVKSLERVGLQELLLQHQEFEWKLEA